MRRALSLGPLLVAVAACAPSHKGANAPGSSSEFDASPGPAVIVPASVAPAPGEASGQDAGNQPSRPAPPPRPQMSAAAAQSYQAGMAAFAAGNLEGAREQFERALSADARAYQARFALGVLNERLGDDRQAMLEYEKARSVVSDYEPAIAAHADVLARKGDLGGAEAYLQKLRAQLPDSAAVLASLSEVKSLQGDSGAAQTLAQEALKKDPDYRPAMLAIARDHYRRRRLDLALYALKAILDGYGPENPPRDRNNGSATLLRALILKEQGRRAAALADFRRAVELRPDLVEARVNLAKYMLEAGNAPEAVTVLEDGLRFEPANLLVHLALGDAYRLQGRAQYAIQHLEWVLGQDSSVAAAEYNLGLLYLFAVEMSGLSKAQAVEKAIEHLTRYQELSPRAAHGAGDDVDELLQRARNKKAIIEALAAEQQAPPPPPQEVQPPPQGPDMQPAAPEQPAAPPSTGSFDSVE